MEKNNPSWETKDVSGGKILGGMVSHGIVLHGDCPRCNEPTHIECIYPIDEHGGTFSFHFCFSCGLVVKLTADGLGADPSDEIRKHTWPLQQGFSGLVCVRAKDGVSEYRNLESWDDDGEEQVISHFLHLMRDEKVDQDKSFVAKWDEETGRVVKLDPLSRHVLN
jgi:hypothetical protein